MEINEEELKKKVGIDAYRVLREKSTEPPFSGKYLQKSADGIYHCKVCDAPLFKTDSQEDGTKSSSVYPGWPSFNNVIPSATVTSLDTSFGMTRTEISCATCGSHLGHIFEDSETKTGKHYCINSVCLNLDPEK